MNWLQWWLIQNRSKGETAAARPSSPQPFTYSPSFSSVCPWYNFSLTSKQMLFFRVDGKAKSHPTQANILGRRGRFKPWWILGEKKEKESGFFSFFSPFFLYVFVGKAVQKEKINNSNGNGIPLNTFHEAVTECDRSISSNQDFHEFETCLLCRNILVSIENGFYLRHSIVTSHRCTH